MFYYSNENSLNNLKKEEILELIDLSFIAASLGDDWGLGGGKVHPILLP